MIYCWIADPFPNVKSFGDRHVSRTGGFVFLALWRLPLCTLLDTLRGWIEGVGLGLLSYCRQKIFPVLGCALSTLTLLCFGSSAMFCLLITPLTIASSMMGLEGFSLFTRPDIYLWSTCISWRRDPGSLSLGRWVSDGFLLCIPLTGQGIASSNCLSSGEFAE